jgi:hypothetical protein
VQKIKFVGVAVFEKKIFEAIVGGNAYAYADVYAYERPWHQDRRRNSSVLKSQLFYTDFNFYTNFNIRNYVINQ